MLSFLLVLSVAACDDSSNDSDSDANGSFGTSTTVVNTPTVSLPAELPTDLVVTELIAGSGPEAQVGDDLLVNYVGVLSETGEVFDSSYGAEPIEFILGAGKVILGWDQGLVGAQQGTRVQLDIPPAYAYGDRPPNNGDGLIKAGATLSFVVDVVVVLPLSAASDEPQIEVPAASNIEVLQSTELVTGGGATPQDGQSVAIHIVTYRADTGEKLASDWGGPPLIFEFSAQSNVYPGLLAVVKGMHVGGRRQSQVPFVLMFDGQGSEGFGLPAGVDLVVVVDLVAVW